MRERRAAFPFGRQVDDQLAFGKRSQDPAQRFQVRDRFHAAGAGPQLPLRLGAAQE